MELDKKLIQLRIDVIDELALKHALLESIKACFSYCKSYYFCF